MSLTVQYDGLYSPSFVSVFTYKGEDPELWVKAVDRIIESNAVETESKHSKSFYVETGNFGDYVKSLHPFRQFIQYPDNAITTERIIKHALAGEFDKIDLAWREGTFKGGLKTLWSTLKNFPEFRLDRKILDMLKVCGAVSVDFILLEILKFQACTFRQVKDALRRLEKLYLVEYHEAYWSYRHNILR